MSLQASYLTAQDSVFLQRVIVACANAGVNIQSELNTTLNHTNRATYAKLVLNSPQIYASAFALSICANDPTITTVSIDSAIQNAVNSAWNALAGTI